MLHQYKTRGILPEDPDVVSGAADVVPALYDRRLEGKAKDMMLLPKGVSLETPAYQALAEILIGATKKPSDPVKNVELFGKRVVEPTVLHVLFRVLPTATWETKCAVLKDLNVLVVKREENFAFFLQQPQWMSWMPPLLAGLPKKDENRSPEQSEYLKYVMNLFAMVFFYVFNKKPDIDKVLSRFFAQLTLQVGWTAPAVGLGRSILSSLLVKVGNGAKRWKSQVDRPEWDSLFKVANVVEEFIFYRPAQEATMADITAEESSDVPKVLNMPAASLVATVQPSLAAAGSGGAD
jgi:hypothetical protein